MDQLASAMSRPSADVDALLRAVAAGEARALRALYERTSAKLYGICLRLLGNEADAQDALQDVFTTAWRKAAQFDSAKAGAITWLSVLARNKAIDRLRGRPEPTGSLDEAGNRATDEPSQLDVLEQSEDAQRLIHCLEQLDERARSMIRTAFFEGASYPELARRQNVPLPTMKSWIRRGLQRLRGCLEQ